MKELTVGTLIAVFEEIFGRMLFWVLVGAVVLITVAYLYVLIRDRSVNWRKFLLAQLSMPIGAVIAVVFVLRSTRSTLADVGGPVDAIILLGIAAVGAIGLAVLVYTLEALIGSRRTRRHRAD